jgi:multiple sugar transport system substrate-binding protein
VLFRSDWTWDDFRKACKDLTKDFDNDGSIDQYGFVVETWTGEWVPWVYQNGGKILSNDGKQWLMGSPQYIEKNAAALQFLADLVYKDKVAPAVNVTRDKAPTEIFKSGKAAMCTYGRWMCMQFKDIKSFDWDIQVLPKKEKRSSTLFTVAYSIAKDSKNPEAAWRLVKFLTGPVGQKATAMSGQAIPSMKSIAASDDFLAAPAVPQKINAQVFLDSIDYAVPPPTNTKWSRINEIFGRELQKVWESEDGSVTAKSILAGTQKELQAILDEPK